MIYKGINLETYPQIIDFALNLDPIEQEQFVEAYARTGPHALANIGYFSGYYDSAIALKIQEVFKTAHPIFGRRMPSPEEAFEMGQRLGEAARKGDTT